MSKITLTVGGRDYSVACAAGEEEHIAGLGRMIESKLTSLPSGASQNVNRSLLFAALLLADELYDLRQAMEKQAPAAGNGHPPADAVPPEMLESLACRLEALADAFEMPA